MSDVAIAVQQVVRTGLTASYTSGLTATTNTYQFVNDGYTLVHAKKSGAGDCTVTITTPGTVDGMAITDRTVTVVATTGDKFIGPFPPSVYNDANGKVSMVFSETTGLTVAVLRLKA